VDEAGVDAVLVGDSLGMTVLGYESTLPVTIDDMVHHTAAVSRGCSRALVIADMPFMSYQTLAVTRSLVDAGVPVMGHVGLTPQSVNVFGGYRTQGRDAEAAAKLLADCVALERAGAFAVVLECIPAELAVRASELISIPTIGIGAGAGCDGQVQVFHDLLGLGEFVPRHASRYVDLSSEIRRAVSAYANDVRAHVFPAEENVTHTAAEIVAEAELLYASEERE
jgi:3-methyl-2-oxobutanoate hydroxymethyltransferase